jgi:hypothetical protein
MTFYEVASGSKAFFVAQGALFVMKNQIQRGKRARDYLIRGVLISDKSQARAPALHAQKCFRARSSWQAKFLLCGRVSKSAD